MSRLRTNFVKLSMPAKHTRRRGFTVVEMLLSLAIIAVLLTAVALVTHAVLLSYAENTKIAEMVQSARVILHRMMCEARTADAITSTGQELTIVPPTNPDDITEVAYELIGGALIYRQTIMGEVVSHPLISSGEAVQIEEFSVSRETAVDGEGQAYTRSVTVRLTLRSGSNTFPLTASACPRRNLPY